MNFVRNGSNTVSNVNAWNVMDRKWNTETILVVVFELCAGSVAVLGTASNIVNIVVFLKHGFTDVVNISLLAMAFSDLGALIVTIHSVVLTNPWFRGTGLTFDALAVNVPFAGIPRHVFAHITCWITVFLTFERCLCVIFPLRVKTIFTATRLKIIIISLYLMNIISVIPYYLTFTVGWKHYPLLNATVFTVLPTPDQKKWADVHSILNGVLSVIAFFLAVLFTAALVIKLIQKSKWRMSTTNQSTRNNLENMSTRDRKVVRIVIAITSILIICYFPSATFSLVLLVLPSTQYKFRPMVYVFWRFAVLTECINSAANLFIYYNMSSKFRATCKEVFLCIAGIKGDGDGKK